MNVIDLTALPAGSPGKLGEIARHADHHPPTCVLVELPGASTSRSVVVRGVEVVRVTLPLTAPRVAEAILRGLGGCGTGYVTGVRGLVWLDHWLSKEPRAAA